MSGLRKFADEATGESELEVYDNDSGQIVLSLGTDEDFRSCVLSHHGAMELRDHLARLLVIQKEVGP